MAKVSILHAIIMGLVQGLTEFLPVSSSGHLVLFKFLLGANIGENSAFFEILLHLGTFIAVCIVYFKDVVSLIKEFFLLIGDCFRYVFRKKPMELYPERKMLLLVIVASIPTAIIGLVFQEVLEDVFMSSIIAVGCALLVTAALLILSPRIKEGDKQVKGSRFSDALLVGVVQGLAVTPGISRSGSTIVAGQACGFKKEFAIRFSFLISLPAIAGAVLLELTKIDAADMKLNGLAYLIALTVAAVVGYLCIRWMLRLIKKNKLNYFGYYCAVVGLTAILLGLF